MARTRNNPSCDKPVQQHSDDALQSKTTTKDISKAKRTRDTTSNAAEESQQQPNPKKPRTVTKPAPASPARPPEKPARRSARATVQNKAPAVGQKRKRRTKAEIAADKTAAEAAAAMEKKRLEEVALEKQRRITQMNLDEDIDRMEVETRTIRKFSDLDRILESDEEEFAGYNDMLNLSSSSEEAPEAPEDDFEALKVSILHCVIIIQN
ncbi:hypothetical protein HYPSUDRAFT_391821 [Hypholoma sublateritium FD-334 SS-4]|uniref:Uncharacterized protein n=1 Tax=Hypholoma sublateritium (strain FD-334 SS-4) TaxID=945553 RepID=A0A0D2NF90_HYPSF|nr:hypothetical protein HYPSUDRAFT_391821 [Hypholoma sublateritium FD-334 SS-4]